jgi:hypothetical protein
LPASAPPYAHCTDTGRALINGSPAEALIACKAQFSVAGAFDIGVKLGERRKLQIRAFRLFALAALEDAVAHFSQLLTIPKSMGFLENPLAKAKAWGRPLIRAASRRMRGKTPMEAIDGP